MKCTRCGGALEVVDTMPPEKASATKRREARRVVSTAKEYIIRRRRCKDCAQCFYTVEVEIPDAPLRQG
jgi:transcriptional regulator NrdR family protein